MSETKIERLADICEIVVGRTPSRNDPSFWGQGHPWLSIADMNQGLLITKTKEEITDLGAAKGKLIPAGTVLLSFKLSIGKVSISGMPLYTNEAIAALVIKNPKKIDSRYLMWTLKSMDLAADSNRAAMGATLNKAKLQEIRIPIPPLDEQIRRVQIEDTQYAITQKRERQQELYRELEKSVFIDIFGHPAFNPKNFPLVQLSELGDLERGVSKHRPRNAPALMGGPYPLIQTGDVAQSGGYITTYTSTYSQIGLNQSKIWPAGTLCITIAANIAKTGILRFNACFPDSIVGFTSTPETTLYVKFLLEFLQEIIEKSAPQSAQKNINLQTLRNLKVPKPNQLDLLKFYNIVGKIETA